MTDTPETNDAKFPCMTWLERSLVMGPDGSEIRQDLLVRSEVAKKLERERDEARFDLDFRRELFKLQSNTLKSITKQRDRLAEALRSIKNELGVPQPEYPSPVANAVKIANEALQSITPNKL